MTVPSSPCDQSNHVFHSIDSLFLQCLHVYAFGDVFSNMEGVGLGIQQVHDLFVVDFEVAGLDQKLHLDAGLFCFPLLLLHASKNVLKRALHYASKFVCFLITILSTNDMIFILY